MLTRFHRKLYKSLFSQTKKESFTQPKLKSRNNKRKKMDKPYHFSSCVCVCRATTPKKTTRWRAFSHFNRKIGSQRFNVMKEHFLCSETLQFHFHHNNSYGFRSSIFYSVFGKGGPHVHFIALQQHMYNGIRVTPTEPKKCALHVKCILMAKWNSRRVCALRRCHSSLV